MPVPAIRAIAVDSLRFLYGARGFLKDELPTEASGAQKFTQEFGRRACRRYARARGTLAGVSYSPIWSTVCDPYLDSISEGPTGGGNYAPPFTGGQCSGISYLVRETRSNFDFVTGNLTSTQTLDYTGGPGPATFSALPDLDGPSLLTTGRGNITFANSNVVGVAAKTTAKTTNKVIQSSTYAVLRTSGGADTCGDPPGQYAPPTFPPNLPNLPTPPTNPAPGFGNNWEVNILPDGKVTFCVASDCSEGVPPNGGGGPDSGGGPGEPDGDPQETDPNDPNNPNEVSGCVEDDRILTGLEIEVTQAPPNYQGLGDIYYKSCWVWMGPSSDLLDMVIDGRTLESGQFVIPDSNDCTCFKVRANPGFKVSVQPYSRPKEE